MGHKMIRYSLISLLLLSSCYYDNQEDLYQYLDNNCDTTDITFSNSILPIISDECSSCHLGVNALGQVSLNNYTEVMVYIENGELLSDIKGETNMMPKSGLISSCKLSVIEKWINDGAKNN